MKDDSKTNKQLIDELAELSSQNAAKNQSITDITLAGLAVEEARRYAENIVETVREPLLVLGEDLKVISANRNFYRTFKVTASETIGSFIYDLGNKQWDIPQLRKLLEEILPEKQAFDEFEVNHNFEDIGQKVMLLNARQIHRKDIGTKIILLAIEDITERKRLEDLLMESEERYRRLFETASDGILLLEKQEGKITHANPASENMLGYTKNESIGKNIQDIGVMLDMGDFATIMQTLNVSGIIHYNDVSIKTKSGQHIDTDIYLIDKAKLVQCNIRDITERKRTTEDIRKRDSRYKELVEHAEDGIFTITNQGQFLLANSKFCRMLGYTHEECLQLNILDTYPDDIRTYGMQRLIQLGRGETLRFERPVKQRDGKIVFVEANAWKNDDGNIQAIVRDITDRKQAETELKESKALIDAVVENVPLMIFLKESKDLRFVIFNRAGEELLGYDRKDLMGKNNLDLFPPEQAAHFMAKDREVLDGEVGMLDIPEEPILTAKKGQRLVHTRKVCIKGADGKTKYLLGISEDITERKQAEKELKETLESLRKAVSTTIQVMVAAVERRDPYTSGHQVRVGGLACAIASEMGLSLEKTEGLRLAASIHDIGKISVPSEILSKPSKLSDIEFSLIKEHAQHGYEILKDVESPWPLAEIVYQHHEKMDGSGYPRNLKGEEILLEVRILAVADVVEAMASHRPYRPGLGIDAALAEIERNRGIFYDNAVVDACLRLFREKGFELKEA